MIVTLGAVVFNPDHAWQAAVVLHAHREPELRGAGHRGRNLLRRQQPFGVVLRTGERIRVEHWVVAERQGQTAARNMLGQREAFDAVPFFWSQHYDVPINYVGHAEKWDELAIEGDIAARDCLLKYKSNGRVLAIASIYRDFASLQAELAMEKAMR